MWIMNFVFGRQKNQYVLALDYLAGKIWLVDSFETVDHQRQLSVLNDSGFARVKRKWRDQPASVEVTPHDNNYCVSPLCRTRVL